MKTPLAAILLLITFAGRQAAPDLDTVIKRATSYVTQYEADLGNLIGSEEYLQTATWLDAGNPPKVALRMQRRTSSDFLIIQVGTEWSALRKINRIDGIKVKETTPAFEDAFVDSPESNARRLRDMKIESTAQNLGDVQREMNVPTFALHVLRKTEVGRFSFERSGTAKVGGKQVWKIRFRETRGPTLIVGIKGEQLYSTGTLWIEPETGRVFQTEFNVENPYASAKVVAQVTVTYEDGRNVPILVPSNMFEHYDSPHNIIECRADYSRFRPFEVDVKFDISPPSDK